MSSPAAVEIISVPETEYGKTPDLATAHAKTVRWTAEALSGTPTTVESAELRKDRMSGGQVAVGLESGGTIDFELSKDDVYDEFFAGAMMSHWTAGAAAAAASITLTKDGTNDQLATVSPIATADFDGSGRALAIGDIIVLSGFTNDSNNGPVQISQIVGPTTVQVTTQRAAVTETANVDVVLGDYVDIGSTISSWTLSKAYTDVTHLATTDQHSQRYTGSIVNQLSVEIAYGAISKGTFTFLSNGYDQEHPSLHQKIETAGGTVDPAGTAEPLNGSIDAQMVTVDGLPTDFCIQTFRFELNNGSTPQNCIGKIAPTKYNLGPVKIAITTSIYLSDQSYDKFMPAKLSQAPIGIMIAAINDSGGYAFDFRAVQLTFPDPNATGGDAPVIINATGAAKVGEGNTTAMRIWRW